MNSKHNYYFHTKHTAILCEVSEKTIYRWRKDGKMKFHRDMMNGRCLHPLNEINNIRKKKILPELTYNEAVEALKMEYSNVNENL